MTLIMIPSSHEDLLADDTRAIGYLATIMSDRSAQVTPVWLYLDQFSKRAREGQKYACPTKSSYRYHRPE